MATYSYDITTASKTYTVNVGDTITLNVLNTGGGSYFGFYSSSHDSYRPDIPGGTYTKHSTVDLASFSGTLTTAGTYVIAIFSYLTRFSRGGSTGNTITIVVVGNNTDNSNVYVNVNGIWKPATVYYKSGSDWKTGKFSVNVGGSWKSVT